MGDFGHGLRSNPKSEIPNSFFIWKTSKMRCFYWTYYGFWPKTLDLDQFWTIWIKFKKNCFVEVFKKKFCKNVKKPFFFKNLKKIQNFQEKYFFSKNLKNKFWESFSFLFNIDWINLLRCAEKYVLLVLITLLCFTHSTHDQVQPGECYYLVVIRSNFDLILGISASMQINMWKLNI